MSVGGPVNTGCFSASAMVLRLAVCSLLFLVLFTTGCAERRQPRIVGPMDTRLKLAPVSGPLPSQQTEEGERDELPNKGRSGAQGAGEK